MKINENINALYKKNPLVHCITNPISINQCANAVLAVGARPVMAEHPKEVGEITESADALLVNLGNITDVRMESILISTDVAEKNNIPYTLDIVGAACSTFRRDYIDELLKTRHPTVIKGNYSEIRAMIEPFFKSVGVDSKYSLKAEIATTSAAMVMAKKYNTLVLASGKTDIITDGNVLIQLRNGTASLGKITGTGCMLGALCSCYLAVDKEIASVVTACGVLSVCGELARNNKGLGTFAALLWDKLSCVSELDIEKYLRMEETDFEKFRFESLFGN